MRSHVLIGMVALVGCSFDPRGSGSDTSTDAAVIDGALGADSGATSDSGAVIDTGVVLACLTNGAYVAGPMGRRYRAVTTQVDWPTAQAACEADDANLIVIDNVTENTHARGLMSGDFWIGLHDMNMENSFEWVTGVPLSYTFWELGQPDDLGGEDCGEITNAAGEWNDDDCVEVNPYVCECGPNVLATE